MNEKKIYELHKKYAKGEYKNELLDLVWTHSLIVKDIALQLADTLSSKNINIDKKLVETGVLIHDIGCYDCYEHFKKNCQPYIKHGIRGYEILKNEGFSEEISRIAMIHLGVGLVKENVIANNLPLEKNDYIPITLEEELVAYADNFHSKAGPRFINFEESKSKLFAFWAESVVIFDRFKKKFGEPNLQALEEKYGEWQKEMNKWVIIKDKTHPALR